MKAATAVAVLGAAVLLAGALTTAVPQAPGQEAGPSRRPRPISEVRTAPAPPGLPAPLRALDSADASDAGETPGWIDDADLHDVRFVGTRHGWAVGDHGACWKTSDGGRNWSHFPVPTSASLRSVCFLTDQVGWVAGGDAGEYSPLTEGAIFATTDGGEHWTPLARGMLPAVRTVWFFTAEEGAAATDPGPACPSGLWRTADGGRSWQPVSSAVEARWIRADFLNSQSGLLGGEHGQVGLLARGRLLRPRNVDFDLRAVRGVAAQGDAPSWLVGDGGLVMVAERGGSGWRPPAGELAPRLADAFDFRCVAAVGRQVWIAGEPGTVVWHSPDAGEHWEAQFTGQTVPLAQLHFVSATHGCAVGALGLILATNDGGRTWNAVRGGGRRAAYLVVGSRAGQISLPLVARLSLESGYRGVVRALAREDDGPDRPRGEGTAFRLNRAVAEAHGTDAGIDWGFPLGLPGLERNPERIVEEWNRRWEGKLADQMLGRLVRLVRTWRPDVIIIDDDAQGDGLSRITVEAVLRAVDEARDATRHPHLQTVGRLEPWEVRKGYVRLPAGSVGEAFADPYEFMPRLGRALGSAAAQAEARLCMAPEPTSSRRAYRLAVQNLPNSDRRNVNDFFTGIALRAGGDARRRLPPISDPDFDARQRAAQQKQNFDAVFERALADPARSAQFLGEIPDILRSLSREEAARQLAQMATAFRRSGQWELAAAVAAELMDRFPAEPAAREPMLFLLQYWTSGEMAWRRLQAPTAVKASVTTDVAAVRQRLQSAFGTSVGADLQAIEQVVGQSTGPLDRRVQTGDLKVDAVRGLTQAQWQHDFERARRLAAVLGRAHPGLAGTPGVQFVLAAGHRQHRRYRDAEEVYHRWNRAAPWGSHGPSAGRDRDAAAQNAWGVAAAAELWLLNPLGEPPRPFANVRRAAERPHLDGVLSDPCWQRADALPLLADGDAFDPAGTQALVLVSGDAEHLYLAGTMPRHPQMPADGVQLAGRVHDAPLDDFDRVTIWLDVDRDYATAWQFTVDQRGWTAESCWDDPTWNPRWYVAAAGDDRFWRFEAAIPWKEITPVVPTTNVVWNARIVRTLPGVRAESWTVPAAALPRLETGGMLRFE